LEYKGIAQGFHMAVQNMKNMLRFFVVVVTIALAGSAGSQQGSPSAGLGIVRLTISQRQAVFGGTSFGSVGPYELLSGTAYGELDPRAPGNSGIVNLNNAPLNTKGHVEYSVDIAILKPVDTAKGNARLIYDVLNRGRNTALSNLNESGGAFGPNDAGNAFLMRHGYTVVWSGWQADLPNNPLLLKAHLPVASRDGKPIAGTSREEFTDVPAGPRFTEPLTYPAASLDPSAAHLTVREREADPRQSIASSSWRYVDANHVEITAAPGFDRGAIYEFIYPATNPAVAGIGLAAMRDFVSFLRYADHDGTGQANPVRQPGTTLKATLGFGISQSGRVLKDFVYQDFNADISGRMVLDGILPVVSGSKRSFTNYEFAQPGRFSRQHEDHFYPGDQFPFSYATTTDPVTGKTDGLLVQCEKSHTCPRIFHADSDTEFWQGRGSLVVTDTSGHALALPGSVRAYNFSGITHNAAPDRNTRGECQQYENPLRFSPYARALLVALDRWVSEGIAPPASAYPNLKSHTLVTFAQAQASYPAIPGAPFSPIINQLQVVDPKSMPPAASGPSYPLYFPPLTADGNPTGGIEPPEVTVPIGTYAGRNVRAEGFAEGELCGLFGEYIPFAITRQERLASGDPRPSLEERYASQQDYASKRQRAVDALVQKRFVLPEDAAALAAGTLPGTRSSKL
jgi:hypothetical protein